MATKTFEELKQLAIQIRDEKTNKQNTATRIGTQMLEHLDKLEQDYYDKTATNEELQARDEKLTELGSNKDGSRVFVKNKVLSNAISEIYAENLPENQKLYLTTLNRKFIASDGKTYWVIGIGDNETGNDNYALRLFTTNIENEEIITLAHDTDVKIHFIINWSNVPEGENKFRSDNEINTYMAINTKFSPTIQEKGLRENFDNLNNIVNELQYCSLFGEYFTSKVVTESSECYFRDYNIPYVSAIKYIAPIDNPVVSLYKGNKENYSVELILTKKLECSKNQIIDIILDNPLELSSNEYIGMKSNFYFDGTLTKRYIKGGFSIRNAAINELPNNGFGFYPLPYIPFNSEKIYDIRKNKNGNVFVENEYLSSVIKELYIENSTKDELYIHTLNRNFLASDNKRYWVVGLSTNPDMNDDYAVLLTTTNIENEDVILLNGSDGSKIYVVLDWSKLNGGENKFTSSNPAKLVISKVTNYKFSPYIYVTKLIDSKNKKISVLGDSKSCCRRQSTPEWDIAGGDGAGYPSSTSGVTSYKEMWYGIIAQRLNCEIIWVSAYGGSAVTRGVREQYDSDGSVIKYMPICDESRWGKLYSNGDTGDVPDIILVSGGINDFISNAKIGSYDDDSEEAKQQKTFYSAYKYLINGLIEKYPNATIITVTPAKMYGNWFSGGSHTLPIKNAQGILLGKYIDAIKEVSSKNGAICIDIYNYLNSTPFNYKNYTYDGLHYNKNGMLKVGLISSNFMKIVE